MTNRRELADRLQSYVPDARSYAAHVIANDLAEAARLLREPVAGEVEAAMCDPNMVHINMLRDGIAKLTPEQIGHLYRDEEAVRVVAEVQRQNPEAFLRARLDEEGKGGA